VAFTSVDFVSVSVAGEVAHLAKAHFSRSGSGLGIGLPEGVSCVCCVFVVYVFVSVCCAGFLLLCVCV